MENKIKNACIKQIDPGFREQIAKRRQQDELSTHPNKFKLNTTL
ncbi:TPA: hypothetical protein ACTUT5_002593 [Legionella anisa]|nr:hypothetical protein [Legionella anisa]MCW8424782.1 hypothetical protein [Legionella anisa]MCW8446099.1 hypothetical protein [Legionella anisa]